MPNQLACDVRAVCSADGLGPLMQDVLDARKAAAVAAAAKQAATSKPSAVDTALKEPGKGSGQATTGPEAAGEPAAGTGATAATLEAAAASGANTLDLSVRLLAGMGWAGLDQLDAASGKAKKLAVYRWAVGFKVGCGKHFLSTQQHCSTRFSGAYGQNG